MKISISGWFTVTTLDRL